MEKKWYIRGNNKYANEIKRYFEIKANVIGFDCDCCANDMFYFDFLGIVISAQETDLLGERLIENYIEIPLSEVLAVVNKKEYNLKPFDKVLVRCDPYDVWMIDFFSHYNSDEEYSFICLNNMYYYCIPYEGNEHLHNTTDSPK